MHFVRCARQVIVYAAFVVAYIAIVALAQARFVPAHYRDGALPQIPFQALGGGEVFLELTVTSTGGVSAVRILRATPPFTETLSQAVRGWRFVPAEEEMEPEAARPGAPALQRAVDSRILVAGLFRPPTLNTPTLGEPPADVALASDETPFPLTTVMPAYPPLARDSGTVLVEAHVDLRGDVVEAVAIRSAPPFDAPAIDAARRWKFRPARLHGRSIDTLTYIVFAFRQPVTVVQGRGSE